MSPRPAALVLDDHLSALRDGLERDGFAACAAGDFHPESTRDPDVIRAIARGRRADPWVLVTMDATVVDEHPDFEWEHYAIAWVVVEPALRGIALERAKAETVRRHAPRMLEQRPGDQFTYTRRALHRHPPALLGALARSASFRG